MFAFPLLYEILKQYFSFFPKHFVKSKYQQMPYILTNSFNLGIVFTCRRSFFLLLIIILFPVSFYSQFLLTTLIRFSTVPSKAFPIFSLIRPFRPTPRIRRGQLFHLLASRSFGSSLISTVHVKSRNFTEWCIPCTLKLQPRYIITRDNRLPPFKENSLAYRNYTPSDRKARPKRPRRCLFFDSRANSER